MQFGTTFAGLLPEITRVSPPSAPSGAGARLAANELVRMSISGMTVKIGGEINSSLDVAAWNTLGELGSSSVSLHSLIGNGIRLVTAEQELVHNADGTTTVTYTSHHWDGVDKVIEGMGQNVNPGMADSAGALQDMLIGSGTQASNQMLGFVSDLPDKLQDAISLSAWSTAFPGLHPMA